MVIATINSTETFNTAYSNVNTSDTQLSNSEKSVLEHLFFFDKTFADNNPDAYNTYDTGLYYDGDVSSPTEYHLRLSTVTDGDIEQYIKYLKTLDTNATGLDDTVKASDIIALVEHARKISLQTISTPASGVKTVDTVKSYFNSDGTVKNDNKDDLREAVTAFDKLNDAYDITVTKKDLRAFARTYGLNAIQKEALEDLYTTLGNVFGS